MGTDDLSAAVRGIREESVGTLIDQYLPKNVPHDEWDLQGLNDAVWKDFATRVDVKAWVEQEPEIDEQVLRQRVVDAVHASYDQKAARIGSEYMRHIEKDIMLRTLDQQWRDHLAAMDYLRQGIHLRGYAQKDYRFEYKREAFELFSAMLDRVKFETVSMLSKIEIRTPEEVEREEEERRQRLMRALQAQHAQANSLLAAEEEAPQGEPRPASIGASGATPLRPAPRPVAGVPAADPHGTFVRGERKVGRNEPCPCGSGKKYKHCHGALAGTGE
jgi:preprotein translocase subunit SecA